MWTKFSHALKSKQAQDGDLSAVLETSTDELAGPSRSPSKSTGRKTVLRLHRDDGSLRLNSPLKLHIPKKVKSTFNLHANSAFLPLPMAHSTKVVLLQAHNSRSPQKRRLNLLANCPVVHPKKC